MSRSLRATWHPPLPAPNEPRVQPCVWSLGPYHSVQVHVDAFGNNIPGDAANEPSIAIDPFDPQRMAIGWRQFNSVESDFREAGIAFSTDAGNPWTFPGVLSPGVFGSDPVLAADAEESCSAGSFARAACQPDGRFAW